MISSVVAIVVGRRVRPVYSLGRAAPENVTARVPRPDAPPPTLDNARSAHVRRRSLATATVRVHDLRRDVRAGHRAPARSTSARASRTPTARRRCWRPPRGAIADGAQPVPARARACRCCGRPSPRTAPPYGMSYDPDTEVLVTVGATEAISAAMLGLVEPGEEVLLIEPYYDSYAAAVALAGAVRRPVPLRPTARFALDLDALRAAITPEHPDAGGQLPAQPDRHRARPRAELPRSPSWPSSTTCWCSATRSTNTWCSTAPRTSRWPRCRGWPSAPSRVSSAAKTFTRHRLEDRLGVRARGTGRPRSAPPSSSSPSSPAARSSRPSRTRCGTSMAWVAGLRDALQRKRDPLSDALRDGGVRGAPPAAAPTSCARTSAPFGTTDGAAFCRALPERIGVAAVPVSAFTDDPAAWDHVVRFAFCKRDEVLTEAAERLASLAGRW